MSVRPSDARLIFVRLKGSNPKVLTICDGCPSVYVYEKLLSSEMMVPSPRSQSARLESENISAGVIVPCDSVMKK